MKKILTLLTLLGLGGSAYGKDCLRTDYENLDTVIEAAGTCQAKQNLEIHAQSRSYPLLQGNPYTVEYWQGSYVKEIVKKETLLREVYNVCTGQLLSSRNIVRTTRYFLEFAVQNPNLSPTIDATYKLVPMTRNEALVAMTAAYDLCSRFQPNLTRESSH